MTVKRFVVLVNPHSGQRCAGAILEQVKPLLAAHAELDIRITQQPGHARQIAQQLDPAAYDAICLIGGDGTMHEVVSGIMERGQGTAIPLGLIPAGTGNDVAEHLGLSRPLDAAQRIVAGRTCPFDVAEVNAAGQIHSCVTLVGWAGIADINAKAERLRRLGPPRYALAALWQVLAPKRRRARIILDDLTVEDDFLLVVACNTVFSGSGMRLAPCARVDDGKIDVVIVRNASRRQMLRLLSKVFDGSHLDMHCLEYHQVRWLSILAEDGGPLDIDGEIKGTTPLSIRMLPAAIRVFC